MPDLSSDVSSRPVSGTGWAGRPKARWDWDESSSRFRLSFEHDPFWKPLHAFPDHAL